MFVVTTVANAFLFIYAGGPKILNDIFNYLLKFGFKKEDIIKMSKPGLYAYSIDLLEKV